MKRLVVAVVFFGVAGSAVAAGVAASAPKEPIQVCHFTGDKKTPYNVIELGPSGAFHAHYPHHDDIIPPFEFEGATYSRNWDADGQAIWNNGCRPVTLPGGGGPGEPPAVTPSPVIGDPSFTG